MHKAAGKMRFFLLILNVGGACGSWWQDPVLVPEVPVERQSLTHGKGRIYRLSTLRPDTQYEVTISYPAAMPTVFSIELVSVSGGWASWVRGVAGNQRKLLNTEKMIFTTPSDAEAFCAQTAVRVTAVSEGVSWDPAYEAQPVLYNIVLSRNVLGVPLNVLPHVCAVLGLVGWVLFVTFSQPARWPASILLDAASAQQGKDS